MNAETLIELPVSTEVFEESGRTHRMPRPSQGYRKLSRPAPHVCSAHGLPEVRRVEMVAKSALESSQRFNIRSNVLTTLGNLSEDAEKVILVRTRWPLCRRCARIRTTFFGAFLGMLSVGIALLICAIVLRVIGGQSAQLGLPLYMGFGLTAVSVIPFVLGSIPRLTKTVVSKEGTALIVREPHPTFVRAAKEITS